jgi:NTP pyrophosphatase (non-canonical NTP hydrolase)
MSEIISLFTTNVRRLFVKPQNRTHRAIHASVGISGEAGEIADCLKKHWIYGEELDLDNLREELGDLLFYLVALADLYSIPLTEVMQCNIDKLSIRYPDGYTDHAAIARVDK